MTEPPRRTSLLRRNFSPVRIYLPAAHPDGPIEPDVVLIQGFFTTPTALDPMRRRLEHEGLTCAAPRLGGMRGGYQTARVGRSAIALHRWLAARDPARPPWIVAHSLGGIIARSAVQHHGARVAGLITLGAPHRGTPTAVAGLVLAGVSRAPMDLLPMGRTIRRLNRQPWPDHVPLLSISGGADLLCPPPFGRLPVDGAQVHRRHHRGMGHTEMLSASVVLDEVSRVVRGGPLGAP